MGKLEFVEFYKNALKLEDDDFNNFISTLDLGLPSTFRVTPTYFTDVLKNKFEEFSFVAKVPYLENVYTFDLKNRTDEYKKFIAFLVAETNIGLVQRQEIVSILPHMFMDVHADHYVLETCASPGSKTKNLLETIKTGLLISNDKTQSRVNILITESMKKSIPSFIVTKMDATSYKNMSIKFDRICCDVPCTGDGTVRKNPAVMPKWNVKNAIGLSSVQLKILKRSLSILKEDGILVYSTCSWNPIEDEWVVDQALKEDGVELVQNFDFIQHSNADPRKITVRKGITSFDYDGFSFDNPCLEACMRIMPQDQNTGGFFVAVLRKTKASAATNSIGTGRMNPTFFEATDEVVAKIRKNYDISKVKDHFVSFNGNFKNLFAVSPVCYEVLVNNPKLPVSYAGVKAFTESDLRPDSFRARSAYMEIADISADFSMSLKDFKLLLAEKDVENGKLSFAPKDIFTVQLMDTPLKFSGFSSRKKTFLYIDDNHRAAFSQIYLN